MLKFEFWRNVKCKREIKTQITAVSLTLVSRDLKKMKENTGNSCGLLLNLPFASVIAFIIVHSDRAGTWN
jgi:hypothetical protein